MQAALPSRVPPLRLSWPSLVGTLVDDCDPRWFAVTLFGCLLLLRVLARS